MPSVETKAILPETKASYDKLQRQFHEFKEANEERLAQLEERATVDVLTEEKLGRIDRALDETKQRIDRMALDSARPRIGDSAYDSGAHREHKAAFSHYVRAGEAGGLKAIESKAMSAGSGPDGGYLVPVPAEREILRRMAVLSPIRSIASVREISTASLRKA